MKVRITKININPNSLAKQSETVEEYRNDQERGTWGQFFEGKSPPVDYWVEGFMMKQARVGDVVVLDRTCRNGIDVRGIFTTSKIKGIEKADHCIYITTENSVYKLEKVKE